MFDLLDMAVGASCGAEDAQKQTAWRCCQIIDSTVVDYELKQLLISRIASEFCINY